MKVKKIMQIKSLSIKVFAFICLSNFINAQAQQVFEVKSSSIDTSYLESKNELKDYILDKNERTLKKNNIHLKITEKEINFIENLHVSSKPLSREFILKNIWNYSTDTYTHTVETHIYRLRQKIKNQFKDNSFIKNSKKGYSL